jgi:hypothetical protein
MQLADIQGGRAPGTSSANPVKLRRYSQDGLELVTTLQAKASAVVDTIHTLAAQGYPRSVGDAHVRFRDLTADWYHLDEFAGDVADGFFRASGPGQSLDGLVGMDDAQLAQLGRLGFADRDQAINEARRLAGELDRLRRGERVNVRDLFNAIRRAQYDPAFAVTFSERIGVQGYVEAAAMLRGIYEQPSGDVSAEGVDALRALSGTLTTALDTLPGTPEAERHDPGNAGLLDGQRLSFGFVGDLTSGYQPDPTATQRFGSPANQHDLAALIGFTAPPTVVAVAIANSRMRQRLTMDYSDADTDPLGPNAWGRHGGLVSAYAGMLSRNDDAAALFLSGDGVLEGALRRHEAYDVDGGAAVGDLVESALTHENPGTREPLMHRAITEVGRSGEINGPHMVNALTNGYGWNRDLISGFKDPTDLENTANMLAELRQDPQAKARIDTDTRSYIQHRLDTLPADGLERNRQLNSFGRLHQLNFEADLNILVDDLNDARDNADRTSALVNFAVGNLPGDGPIETPLQRLNFTNDALKVVTGKDLGDLVGDLTANPDSGPLRDALQSADAVTNKSVRDFGLGHPDGDDAQAFKTGTGEVVNKLREFNLPAD